MGLSARFRHRAHALALLPSAPRKCPPGSTHHQMERLTPALQGQASASARTFWQEVLQPSILFNRVASIRTPGFHTGGDGPVTGQEVRFTVNFTTPFNLPADHYFFVPQVQLDTGNFLWLSAPRPIVAPGTPFPSGVTVLQAWARDEFLDPDWLRIGSDIVGGTPAPTFNLAFSLEGDPTPLPGALPLFATGLGALSVCSRWRRKT